MLSQESQCRLGITVREEMQSAFPEADDAQNEIMALSESWNRRATMKRVRRSGQLAQAQINLNCKEPKRWKRASPKFSTV
jgi:hypothetical protein